jgi:WD40 repeat protein
MTQHQPAIKGGWFEAKRQELVAAVPDLHDASLDVKLGVIEQLRAKLEALREWDRWDPTIMDGVVEKTEYRQVEKLKTDIRGVDCFRALPDGRIVSRNEGGPIRIWSRGPQDTWRCEGLPLSSSAVRIQALPDERIVAVFVAAIIWNRDAQGKWVNEGYLRCDEEVLCAQALPDGRIICGCDDGALWIWRKNAQQEWEKESLPSIRKGIRCLQALPDGRIFFGDEIGRLGFWDKDKNGRWDNSKWFTRQTSITCLQVLPNGRIVSGSSDGSLRIWSEGSHYKWESVVLRGHEKDVTCLHVLPDGRIVSGSRDKSIRIWSPAEDGKWKSTPLLGHDDGVTCLQALSDGRIVSGSRDGTIRIWDGTPVLGGAS